MKLDTMQEFLLLSVNRNFSKTAEELYMAQSALSRHVAALEQELGVQLIHRTHNTFELTHAGEIVAQEFKRMLDGYQTMLRRLASLSENFEGELHVGALYHNLDWYIYPIWEAFRSHYPKVKLCLHSYQPVQLVADVVSGKLDVGFGNNSFVRMDKLFQTYPFWKVPLCAFFDCAHPLAEKEQITPEDLEGQTGLFKGFGVLPQQAETAVSGNAGNRCFESLWEQRHCLPSSATADSQALLLIIFLLLFHQSGITKELFPGRNSQFAVDILVVKL